MSFIAKSIILDIAGNWGDPTYTAGRSMEFIFGGSVISVAPADITTYQSATDLSGYDVEQMFDTSLSKSDSHIGTCWGVAATANMRIIVVFDAEIEFDGITFNNFLGWDSGLTGYEEDYGMRNTKIRVSTDAITDTTYNASVPNSAIIFDSELAIHSTTNQVEDQVLTLVAASVSGIVTEGATPVARTVRAYNRNTGALIAETVSAASDGSYSIGVGGAAEVFVIAFDDDAGTQYNAVILDNITPI